MDGLVNWALVPRDQIIITHQKKLNEHEYYWSTGDHIFEISSCYYLFFSWQIFENNKIHFHK